MRLMQAAGFILPLFLPLCLAAPAPTAALPADPNAVAVLWFANKGSEQDWLHTGLSELLIGALSHIPSVRVVERARLDALEKEHRLSQLQQAEAFKRLANLERVGRVVVGTFKASGERLEIHAALVDTEGGEVVSTATAQGQLEQLGVLVEELARDLLRRIGARLSEAELAKLRLVPTYDFPALQWHARGRDRFVEGAYADALEAFWRAAQRDPRFTWALESLAQTYDVVGEPEHALLAYLGAIENVEEAGDTLRLAFQTRRLLEKMGDLQRQRELDERIARKEFAVLERTLKHHPIATMTREEMWRRYGESWRQALERITQSFSVDRGSMELTRHQREFAREVVTLEWMHRYAALLERFGKAPESFAWNDRVLHLQRFLLSPLSERALVQHALRWHTSERAVHPAPEWVVTIDPQHSAWSLPDDPAARERVRFFKGFGFMPSHYYGVVFLAPPGSYILKGTIEVVPEGKPSEPLPLLPLRSLSHHGGVKEPPDWFLESQVRLMEAMRKVFTTLPPEQRAQRARELQEQELRERTQSTAHTYLTPPGTPGMWAMLPLHWWHFSPSRRSPIRGWQFNFVLTRSSTETTLPEWMWKTPREVRVMRGWGVTVDPPGTELRVDGKLVDPQRMGAGTNTVSVPEGTLVRFELRAPDGRQKSFDLRALDGGNLFLSTRNGWKPLPEPLQGNGFLMRDRQGTFWFVSTRLEPTLKRTDIYLQQSRDLVTWSEPMPVPFNTAYTEGQPVLVQQSDGALRLFWFSDRPAPAESSAAIWTATSEDGVQWSEPTVVTGVSLEQLRNGVLLSTAQGLAWFYFYGSGTDVWHSADGQRWQREQPHVVGLSRKGERYRLISVAPAADSTLRGVWQLPPTSSDPQGTSHRLVEVASIDGVRWEVTATLLSVPDALERDLRSAWRSKHGWLAVFDHQPPDTTKGSIFYVLLRPQNDARLLPPFDSPYPPRAQWIETDTHLIAVWSRFPHEGDGYTHIWTCPVNEIADQPFEQLPRFDPHSLR